MCWIEPYGVNLIMHVVDVPVQFWGDGFDVADLAGYFAGAVHILVIFTQNIQDFCIQIRKFGELDHTVEIIVDTFFDLIVAAVNGFTYILLDDLLPADDHQERYAQQHDADDQKITG